MLILRTAVLSSLVLRRCSVAGELPGADDLHVPWHVDPPTVNIQLDQDDIQLYQGWIKTRTKATGGNETDTRTGGDFQCGQDDSHPYQDGDKNTRTGGDFELYQDGPQRYQDKTTTNFELGQEDFQLYQDRIKT